MLNSLVNLLPFPTGVEDPPAADRKDDQDVDRRPSVLREGPVHDHIQDDLLQQFSVLLEYERLQDLLPSGMYLMPSFESILSWSGAIFARQGFYKGGVFKFVITLSEQYPAELPEIRFLTDIFHPLVDPATGLFDIGTFFPKWRPGKDYVTGVLPHLHWSLLRRDYFSKNPRPPNPAALELFKQDPAAFAARAAESASRSWARLHSYPRDFSLKFANHPREAHDLIRDQLFSADPSLTTEERTAAFADWFCEHYARERASVRLEDSPRVETVAISPRSICPPSPTGGLPDWAPAGGWEPHEDTSEEDDDLTEDDAGYERSLLKKALMLKEQQNSLRRILGKEVPAPPPRHLWEAPAAGAPGPTITRPPPQAAAAEAAAGSGGLESHSAANAEMEF